MDWPPVGEQVERMDEALEIINRLLDGERLDHDGRFFRTKAAYLHTRGERRPPVYVSAFGPHAAAVAARRADGLWTLADPEHGARRSSMPTGAPARTPARCPGEIILQAGFSWAQDDDAALEGVTRLEVDPDPDDYFTDDWHDPRAMYERAEKRSLRRRFPGVATSCPQTPSVHAERIREVERLGATVVCLQNGSGAAPEQALQVYGAQVLPVLRGARV